jgi:Dcp2, box A domain
MLPGRTSVCLLSFTILSCISDSDDRHWFYEDFVREGNPQFPSLPLKKFSQIFFHACPVLHQWSSDFEIAFNNFMQYKTRVPVCGAIMLNDTWEKVRIIDIASLLLLNLGSSASLSKAGNHRLDGAFRKGRSIKTKKDINVLSERSVVDRTFLGTNLFSIIYFRYMKRQDMISPDKSTLRT